MIFQRLLYKLCAFFFGLALGTLAAPELAPLVRMKVDTTASLEIGAVIGVLFVVMLHLLLTKVFNKDEDNNKFKGWAWLKPAGMAARSPYPLNKEQITIGRDVNCDILLTNDSISRRHAEIVRSLEGWTLRNLGSRNGTFVNGQHVDEILLKTGDVITLGDINLTFEGATEPQGALAPGDPGLSGAMPNMPFGELTATQVSPMGGDTAPWNNNHTAFAPRPNQESTESWPRREPSTESWPARGSMGGTVVSTPRPRPSINSPEDVDDL